MRKVLFTGLILTLMVSMASADIGSFSITDEQTFQEGDTIEFQAEASETDSVNITVLDASDEIVLTDQMNNVSENEGNQTIYEYSYTVDRDAGGQWAAQAESEGDRANLGFHVATDRPIFKEQFADPSFVRYEKEFDLFANVTHVDEAVETVEVDIFNTTYELNQTESFRNVQSFETTLEAEEIGEENYELTAEDGSGNLGQASNTMFVYESESSIGVGVEIAPSCSSGLDYFLVPGDGQIVQNNTGVFVEIISNRGNVESNITVDYIDVTSEGDQRWAPGDPIGDMIQEYDGDVFENIGVGETATYFELFHASHDLGNYTGRSSITTECLAEGPQDTEEDKNELESEYSCGDTDEERFECFKEEVFNLNLVVSETNTVNLTEETEETVSAQTEDTEGYEGEMLLNSTEYLAYVFDGTAGSGYDYACTTTGELDEDRDCAYEGDIIHEYDIEVQGIEEEQNGVEASFAKLEENEDLLNDTKDCSSIDDDLARCNTTFEFFEQFSFFGNFEIVDALGEDEGGVNQTGEEETNETLEGDQDDVPGETPEPEPDPVPEPEPEPQPEPEPEPVLSIDIEPVNDSYTTRQGSFAEANFEATNIGNVNLTDISLVPEAIDTGWEVEEAQIANLDINQTVERNVYVRPPEDAALATYAVPVAAEAEDGRRLDLDYFSLEVLDSDIIPSIRIEEAPQTITVEAGEEVSIPVLIQNNGDQEVTDVRGRLENIDDCGAVNSTVAEGIEEGENSQLSLNFRAEDTAECETLMVFSSEEGAYAFSDLNVTVVPERALIPEERRAHLIALFWTLLLIAYGFATREYSLDSWTIKAPYVLLIVGEMLIFIYIASTMYSIPGMELLPF